VAQHLLVPDPLK